MPGDEEHFDGARREEAGQCFQQWLMKTSLVHGEDAVEKFPVATNTDKDVLSEEESEGADRWVWLLKVKTMIDQGTMKSEKERD